MSLAFVRGIHRWPIDSPQKGPATRNIFPFDDFIMHSKSQHQCSNPHWCWYNTKIQTLTRQPTVCKILEMCHELTHPPSSQCRIYESVNCVITGTGNELSPVRRQAITWTSAGLLSIGRPGTSFNDIWIGILSISFEKMHLKMSSAKIAAILSRDRWVKEMA